MKILTPKNQMTLTVILLCLLAATGIIYKLLVLGFTLKPNDKVTVWQVEAQINLKAHNQPVKISLAAPEKLPGCHLMDAHEISPTAYQFAYTGTGNDRRAEWTSNRETGPQTIFYRMKLFDIKKSKPPQETQKPELGERYFWEDEGAVVTVRKLLEESAQPGDNDQERVLKLMTCVFSKAEKNPCAVLLGKNPSTDRKLDLMLNLLRELELPARPVYGVILQDGRRRQLVKTFEVYHDNAWHPYNPYSLKTGYPDRYLALRRGGKSLLDVEGGTDSSVRYSVFKSTEPLLTVASVRAQSVGHTFGSFSVYSLPLESQNMFKRIALIPLGILIVVIVRNLIGIQTMGTFMPVLIAMAFLETRLVPGLVSFLAITALGLLIRTFLSRLNLLLVPRIAAVVMVVILLMKAFCITSFRLGFTDGLAVTMFPLIIMAWTIERASILWEEDGPINTLKQFSASLVTGIVCYLIMANPYVQHITFAFAEIDLFILALILLLGTYTGYRLTELRRFKSLVKK